MRYIIQNLVIFGNFSKTYTVPFS